MCCPYYVMRNHFNIKQRVHIIANLTADCFANMLHIIKSFDDAIIINAEEKGTTPYICLFL